jgi:hypothetical protein
MTDSKQLRDVTGELVTQFRTEGPAPPPNMEETVSELEAADESTDRKPKIFSLDPPLRGVAPTDDPRSKLHARRSKPASPKPCSAVFVAHGMGQQIPFETLDDVVEGIRRQDLEHRQGSGEQVKKLSDLPQPRSNTIPHGDERLQRVELSILDDTGEERDIHVYEGYWAPLVEGNVTLRDVMGFLRRAGSNGIQNGAQPFQRWIFGKYRDFGVSGRTVRRLMAALLVVFSLTVMNFTLLAVMAARSPLGTKVAWLNDALFADLTTVFNVALAGMLALALPVLAGAGLQRMGAHESLRKGIGRLSWLGFIVAMALLVAAGAAIPILFLLHALAAKDNVQVNRVFLRSWEGGWLVERFDVGIEIALAIAMMLLVVVTVYKLAQALSPHPPEAQAENSRRGGKFLVAAAAVGTLFLVLCWALNGLLIASLPGDWRWLVPIGGALSWILLALASLKIRTLLVQFPGDVAVYVSSHNLDRFNQLRQEVRDCVYKQAEAVYSLREGHRPAYDSIFIVGHSLGSAIVYDVLNRLIVEDELIKRDMKADPSAGKDFRDVLRRTRLLLTFGCPLDKFAFLFSLQGKHTNETRAALVTEVQPMIQHAGFRPFPWVNVWSPKDIIGGSLEFYDPPKPAEESTAKKVAVEHLPKPVDNVEDLEATTLLLAHVEYWRNPTIFQQLHQRLIVCGGHRG